MKQYPSPHPTYPLPLLALWSLQALQPLILIPIPSVVNPLIRHPAYRPSAPTVPTGFTGVTAPTAPKKHPNTSFFSNSINTFPSLRHGCTLSLVIASVSIKQLRFYYLKLWFNEYYLTQKEIQNSYHLSYLFHIIT